VLHHREDAMGSKKYKGASGKRVVRRVGPDEEPRAKQQETPSEAEDKPRVPERIHEADSGFGAIKIVVGVIVVLILAAGVFSRLFGNDNETRGDKLPGEACESTQDCKSGSVCFAYGTDRRRCLATCAGDDACDPGHTCVSTAERAGRKSTRVRRICVEDAKVMSGDK
jgi:hypothetical protein